MKVINCSGHQIIQEGVEVVLEIQIPNVDLSIPGRVGTLARQISGEAAAHVIQHNIPVALPGMTTLAAHVLANLHGMCGFWPRIAWAARNSEGKFAWSEECVSDLHEIRMEARGSR